MACDGLFFKSSGSLNKWHVPGWGLALQGVWAVVLVFPRTLVGTNSSTGQPIYSNLYSDLITYVVSAALIFYILTILGIFRLRSTRPDAERPYRAWGYPVIPFLYILAAAVILVVLFIYQSATSWPGLIIVATGVPVYFFWRSFGRPV
jgi:APA family basic amino acid/polyamine antiporter